MRATIITLLILFLAGCAGTPDGPPATGAVEPSPPPPKRQRFDDFAELAETSAPERNVIRARHRYDRSIKPTKLKGVRYYFYEPNEKPEIVGFALQNFGSPNINPRGLKTPGPRREYAFLFADRARENIHLAINDDVKLSGRFSHDNMFREWHFFPRNQLPNLRVDHAEGVIEVTLPTGEAVHFDQQSKEMVGGAMAESPVDFNGSRHLRRNPEVRYQGDYLAITVAQRGEAPRRAKVWGQTKFAEVHYPSRYPKACKLSPSFIWDQKPKPGDTDPTLHMKYATDAELFAMIERRCGWNLASLKEATQKVAESEN
jgi:hypothetical protein